MILIQITHNIVSDIMFATIINIQARMLNFEQFLVELLFQLALIIVKYFEGQNFH